MDDQMFARLTLAVEDIAKTVKETNKILGLLQVNSAQADSPTRGVRVFDQKTAEIARKEYWLNFGDIKLEGEKVFRWTGSSWKSISMFEENVDA